MSGVYKFTYGYLYNCFKEVEAKRSKDAIEEAGLTAVHGFQIQTVQEESTTCKANFWWSAAAAFGHRVRAACQIACLPLPWQLKF